MKGIVAASGMALAMVHLATQPEIDTTKKVINNVPEELERFRGAVGACYSRISAIMEELSGSVDPKTIEILDFQLLLLEDAEYIDEIERTILGQHVNTEYVVESVSNGYIHKLDSMTDNDYLRERASDISDLSQRLLAELAGLASEISEPDEPFVAISVDIPPSRIAEFDKSKLKGIILEKGSITSHCVILSRSLGIPCLIETTGILEAVNQGDIILLDAVAGEAIIKPVAAQIEAYDEYTAVEEWKKESLSRYIGLRSITRDGAEMKIYANVTTSEEAESVVSHGGEGVGLFRSELLYMAQHSRPPSEEIQFLEYSKAAKALDGRPLIIRTLDIGGDKQIDYMDIGREDNPFLGYRAVRYCIDHPEIFKPQISAILRAGCAGNVLMMFPMITCKAELLMAKDIVDQVRAELTARGTPYDRDMKIGIMIETPAAAVDVAILAKDVDFFSIGSNDLSQYLFAADRGNPKLSNLNSHFQPALLRVINGIAAAAREAGTEVDICGQAAEIDVLIPLWLAMGIDNLSVSIPRITDIRRRICALSKTECTGLLDIVLNLGTAGQVEEALVKFAERNIAYDH